MQPLRYRPAGEPEVGVEDLPLAGDTEQAQAHVVDPHPVAGGGHHDLPHLCCQLTHPKLSVVPRPGHSVNIMQLWALFATFEKK